jgi:hypothetical protein
VFHEQLLLPVCGLVQSDEIAMEQECDTGGQLRPQGWEGEVAHETCHKHQQGHDPHRPERAVALLLCTPVTLLHDVFSYQGQGVMAAGRAR